VPSVILAAFFPPFLVSSSISVSEFLAGLFVISAMVGTSTIPAVPEFLAASLVQHLLDALQPTKDFFQDPLRTLSLALGASPVPAAAAAIELLHPLTELLFHFLHLAAESLLQFLLRAFVLATKLLHPAIALFLSRCDGRKSEKGGKSDHSHTHAFSSYQAK